MLRTKDLPIICIKIIDVMVKQISTRLGKVEENLIIAEATLLDPKFDNEFGQ